MNLSSIISVLEGGIKGIDNRNAKIDEAKSLFSNNIGVNEEMADKAEGLIDTFSDMDDAIEKHEENLNTDIYSDQYPAHKHRTLKMSNPHKPQKYDYLTASEIKSIFLYHRKYQDD